MAGCARKSHGAWRWKFADALAAAHNAGIVHGNLRPGAILLDDERHVRILDFGLSSLSPMPVQRGEGGAEGDVFALGAILYEALTGRRPGPEPDPLPGTMPPGLAALVMRCLSGEVRTAREVVAAIGQGHDRLIEKKPLTFSQSSCGKLLSRYDRMET